MVSKKQESDNTVVFGDRFADGRPSPAPVALDASMIAGKWTAKPSLLVNLFQLILISSFSENRPSFPSCAGRIKVPLTIRKTVKTTIKVKKTITKTVITGTTTKTVTANSKRLVVERSLMQREDGAAVHDQEQAAQDAVVDDLEPTTDSSSSFFSSSTSEVESEVGNSLLAKRHPFCPACPAGSNVLPYRARTGSGQLCCPPRKRVTKTTKKTIKSTVRVTQTKKIQVTSTITFVATVSCFRAFRSLLLALFEVIN